MAEKNSVIEVAAKVVGVSLSSAVPAQFQLPTNIAQQLNRANSSTIQMVSSQRCSSPMPTNLKMDFLSKDTRGLSLFDKDKNQIAVSGLSTPIHMCLDLDPSLYQGRPSWWSQKASCGYYDSSSSKMATDCGEAVSA